MKTLRNYEPNRKNCFIVKFNTINIEPFIVQQITLPKLINNKWDDITIICIDTISVSTAEILYQFIEKNKNKWFSKKSIFDITISILDLKGNEIKKWTILVKKIKEIDFGYCDYGNDDINQITIKIEPLDCKLI